MLVELAAVVGSDDGTGRIETSLDASAVEIGRSMWASRLRDALVEEFCRREPAHREHPGGLWGMVDAASWDGSTDAAQEFCDGAPSLIRSGNPAESIAPALAIMQAAFEQRARVVDDLVDSLLDMLAGDPPTVHAAAWALWWLSGGRPIGRAGPFLYRQAWAPSRADVRRIADTAGRVGIAEELAARMLASVLMTAPDLEAALAIVSLLDSGHAPLRTAAYAVLGMLADHVAVPGLLGMLTDDDKDVRRAAVEALGRTGDPAVVPALSAMLDEPDSRESAVTALGWLLTGGARAELARTLEDSSEREALVLGYARGRDETNRVLLSNELDGVGPWVDPREPISSERVEKAVAARDLDLDASEVRARYEAMAPDLDLELTWQTSD